MMAGSIAEEKTFRRFLELFLREMRMPLQESDPPPLRPLSDLMTEDEVEGECLDLSLARATADSLLQSDLSIHHLNKTPEEGQDPVTQMESVKLAWLVFNRLFEDQEEQAYFAVFDGHGGVDAAIYAANHLHVNLFQQECFRQDPMEALCKAFRVTDLAFMKKARREHLRCGTTGVVTFLRGRTMYVAWLGDSQVMLVRKGEAVELMKPHKPDREDEKLRIEALGGCVIWFGTWRVNGSLSVSRAIGDSEHKPYISGVADHDTCPMDGTEDYLILACDGFWDTVNSEEAVRVVSDHLEENTGDTTMVAHKLVASARDAGSSDNITVIVVFLRDPRCPPPGGTEDREEGVVVGEEEVEEEDDEAGGGERDGGEGGSNADNGGKARGGWPLQQCSAPADLGYEDRTDSLTDRTSLCLLGPALEGRISLTGAARQPRSIFGLDLFSTSHMYPELRPLRRRSCLPFLTPSMSSFTDPLWPQTAMLLGQAARRSHGPGYGGDPEPPRSCWGCYPAASCCHTHSAAPSAGLELQSFTCPMMPPFREATQTISFIYSSAPQLALTSTSAFNNTSFFHRVVLSVLIFPNVSWLTKHKPCSLMLKNGILFQCSLAFNTLKLNCNAGSLAV
ncbi:hypothetical protein F7725_006541 [Dissostichus mawsoni]|uniref:Protein phosphatase 1E n=1 Tax=Dissostichus mawsoni TaxID=36200 RepID=A0A7J5XW02_DISMA|nr:hypothetical protein F7725_006541 [Dissostichus mawsoni]